MFRNQPSFAKGEVGPELYGRIDTAAFQIGLRKARNCIIHTYGGVSNRGGSKYLAPVKDHSYCPRLFNFEFKTTDKYQLEFGDFYMRVIRNDGHVIEAASKVTIEGATQANPVVITATGHPLSNGYTVEITEVVGMTELNGRRFTVANAAANTFELSGEDGTGHTAYVSGGRATRLLTISGATQANPVVITATAHGLSNGDEVYLSEIVGMTELNGRRFTVASVAANTFELTDQVDGTNIDGTGFTAYSSGGIVGKIYEVATPFAIEDVFELTHTQSADVMTFVHKDYGIYDFSRFDHDDWTIAERVFGPQVDFPVNVTVTVNTTGAETYRYRVTAIAEETGEESLPGLRDVGRTITGATQANPVVITTSAAHNYTDGDEVYIDSVVGMVEINERRFTINVLTTTTFELLDEDGTGYTAYSSGGSVWQTFDLVTNGAVTVNNTITWDAVTGAERYAVYRLEGGTYGLIGETEATTFEDDNIDPDTTESHPRARDPFSGDNDAPGAIGFYEQRQVFGGTLDDPDTHFYSQIGSFNNMNVSRPLRQDDAITATLNSGSVNEIRHFVPGNDLLVLTSGSEWRVNSGPDQAFAYDTLKQKEQSKWGSSWRRPIVIGETVMFVTENNAHVRSLGYSLERDGYIGVPLDLISQHLLKGRTIVEWCYQRYPESRVHMVLDNGKALTLSYEQSQEVIAWTPWDTSGFYETCSAERGGGVHNEDSIYFVVRRSVNGRTVRYIEVTHQSHFEDVQDCYFVDCGLTLDIPITITGISLADPVVVTAPGHGLSNGDEVDLSDIVWEPDTDEYGNETQPDQLNEYRYVVASATTDTFALTSVEDGSNIDGTAFNAYSMDGYVRLAVDTISGLYHLEGRKLSILANGNVITSLTVSGGSVTLPFKASRIHAGLPYITDIETLDVTATEGETLEGKLKKVPGVTIRFLRSRGMFIGPSYDAIEYSPDLTLVLTEVKQRQFEKYGQPTRLQTRTFTQVLDPSWNSNGRVFLRQKDPLPVTILGITPDVDAEDSIE